MASMNAPWPPSMDVEADEFGEKLEREKYEGHVDDLGWLRWSSEYRMHRGNGMLPDEAAVTIFRAIDAIRAGGSPSPTPSGPYDVPWTPDVESSSHEFIPRLRDLYLTDNPEGTPINYRGLMRWTSDYRVHRANRLSFESAWNRVKSDILAIWGKSPVVPGAVVPLNGQVRIIGRSLGDATGPRIVHGCSYFPALVIAHQDPDEFLRQLDRTIPHQQYQRWLWRLNGWHWSGGVGHASANLSVDPLRDLWFEETLRWALSQANDRGLRVNLSTGDMNDWSEDQQSFWFRRVHEIAASVSHDVVWLSAVANEMRGTWVGPESSHVQQTAHLLTIMQHHYPWALLAGSDPGSQDKAGMKMLAPHPANVALIHDVRQRVSDALRRCFNGPYENYPDMPIIQDEPTGPNGSFHGAFSQQVYQPLEDPQSLFALYTMHVITGQGSTYFNDPALVSRQPLDSTWGFKELPALWKSMDIPQNIGQGTLKPGHHNDAPARVAGSGAERADFMVAPDGRSAFGVVSGGGHWRVNSGWDAEMTSFRSDGSASSKHIRKGDLLVTSDHDRTEPMVIRLTR